MDEVIAREIEEIRARLTEIDDEREHLPEDETDRWDELLDEEHKLASRLKELEDRLAEKDTGAAERKASAQTDITRSPRLPDSDKKKT